MNRALRLFCLVLLAGLFAPWPNALAQWVEFVEATGFVLNADPALVADDQEEKDYAWGDVDNDGDIDLVIARKEPFTTFGRRANVLLINEAGLLTDRTVAFATASDVAGDFGFKTPTNDRDVVLVDVDLDGWLDVVTAPTLGGSDPKHIGHPRVYRNRGCTGSCAGTEDWLGFIHEGARIPQLLTPGGQETGNPRFCAVSAGDVTGDGYPDLYFTDYDSSVLEPMPGPDFNDKLLINLGAANPGVFVDVTDDNFAGVVPGIQVPFEVSEFGTSNAILDMNGDGLADIVKNSSLVAPYYVGIAFNDPDNAGFFESYDVAWQGAPYFVSAGDLNNDGWPELIVTEDGADRYFINQHNGDDEITDFISYGFSFSHGGSGSAAFDDGFGGNSLVADLNNDGWNDVLIADVDVDVPGCDRRMHIYRNLGGTPPQVPILQEQTAGSGCALQFGNPPSCIVAGIPSNKLVGVHDVAVFDIDGDGWNDAVIGRCSGTEVHINVPPVGLVFTYPQGLPFFAPPGQPFDFTVQVNGFGGAVPVPDSGKLFVSVNEGPFTETSMTDLGGDLYRANLPAAGCSDRLQFYVSAGLSGDDPQSDPPGAPANAYKSIVAVGSEIILEESVEDDVSQWTVVNDPGLTAGAWEQAVPIGSLSLTGQLAAPDQDAEAAVGKVMAFVTQNGLPGGAASAADVDGGPTDLISPVLDLSGTDADIHYRRWFFNDNGNDMMTIWVTGNGTDWVVVDSVSTTNSSWRAASFRVGEFITPTDTVQVRFRADDSPNNSVTEAGIDQIVVDRFVCSSPGASGAVPSEGTPLTLAVAPNDEISLSWGASCSPADVDYEVYEGALADFYTHTARLCSTGGATTALFTPAAGDTYYLVVPTHGSIEGSYGIDSDANPRPQGATFCLPQTLGACP